MLWTCPFCRFPVHFNGANSPHDDFGRCSHLVAVRDTRYLVRHGALGLEVFAAGFGCWAHPLIDQYDLGSPIGDMILNGATKPPGVWSRVNSFDEGAMFAERPEAFLLGLAERLGRQPSGTPA